MAVRVRDGEKTSQWEPTEAPIDLGVLGLTGIVEEYDELESRIKRDVARRDEIKEAMKALGRNRELKVNGEVRFELRNDGQFMPMKFKKDYPGYAADFEVKELVTVFDLERFKAEMPSLYREYRAPKIIRVNNS